MKIKMTILTALCVASTAFSEVPWDEAALTSIQQSVPEKAIKIAKEHDDTTQGQILLCMAYAQEYDQSQTPRSMAKATQLYKDLLPKVAMNDAVTLHMLRKLKGSLIHSYSETLLEQALRRIETPAQAKAAPAALKVIYKSERYKVFAILSDWLRSQRARLLNGEPLDEETRLVFTDPALITALTDMVEVGKKPGKASPPRVLASLNPKPEPATGAKPSPSAKQPPRTNATARECLILIEEPAIPIVQAALPQLGDEGISLLSDLCAAKTLRENKAPGFLWSVPGGY
ncbi:MAG: hypothetical protein V2A34_14355 [Lentisphaerota bacterium]